MESHDGHDLRHASISELDCQVIHSLFWKMLSVPKQCQYIEGLKSSGLYLVRKADKFEPSIKDLGCEKLVHTLVPE